MSTSANKSSELLPAYLVVGEDALKRSTVLERLRKRMSSMGDLSFNSDSFDASSCTANDVVAACNTIPFASPVRLVELGNVDKFAKADSELLVSYLKSPAASTVLAISADKLAKNTRLYKAIEKLDKSAIIDCTPPKAYEFPKLVRSMAPTHGVTITERAAALLVEYVGTDTVHLDAELKKLALAHQGRDPINETEVRSFVSRTSEVKWWDFIDAMSERNLAKALNLLAKMPSTTPYELLPRCVNRIRDLMCAQSLSSRSSIGTLAKELGLRDWQVKNYAQWSRRFTPGELRAGLVSARDAERKMKSGTDPSTAFNDWLLDFLKK